MIDIEDFVTVTVRVGTAAARFHIPLSQFMALGSNAQGYIARELDVAVDEVFHLIDSDPERFKQDTERLCVKAREAAGDA